MESCHSVQLRVPAFRPPQYITTLGHLIKIIEQLKNKDKIISHLEKELGHQSGYALQLQLEKEVKQDQNSMTKMEATITENLGSSNGKIGDGCGTNTNKSELFPEGEAKRALDNLNELEAKIRGLDDRNESLAQDKEELTKKLKEVEQKNRQLNEKNRKFLEKNVELTSQTRSLKDQTQLLTEENKKLKEQTEHSKHKVSQLLRQLSEEKVERTNMELKINDVDIMKQQMSEQGKTISALKQCCSEKDRRIELIQHRKKRRRLLRSQEKCCGVKETFYGYDEDSKSVDSETSLSSMSYGTISDDDLWNELSREEVEKNYQRLMREHHELEKSYALLQSQTESYLDPQRDQKLRSQLESDLFMAQCRIEELEKILKDLGQGEAGEWLKEKLFTTNEELTLTVQAYELECHSLRQQLAEAQEQMDNREFTIHELEERSQEKVQAYELECQDLRQQLAESKEHAADQEFRILELEEHSQEKISECCSRERTPSTPVETELQQKLAMSETVKNAARLEIEQLRRELAGLLEGRGHEADIILQQLDKLKDAEQQIENLECTARELQEKVIQLQQEKTALEDMLRSPRRETEQGGYLDKEREEVLALKNQLVFHEKSELELMEKNAILQEKLLKTESENNHLKRHVEKLDKSRGSKEESYSTNRKAGRDNVKYDQSIQTVYNKAHKSTEIRSDDEKEADIQSTQLDVLERKLQQLHEENLRLRQKLEEKRHFEDEQDSFPENSQQARVDELEDYCDDLKDRMQMAEMSERQLREKLKLAEHTINDLESSEGNLREKVESMTRRENEAKRQAQELHRTVRELKEIVLDKDIIEQALRDKVEFLEKAEVMSSKMIGELQASEKNLLQQLELKGELENDVQFVEKMKEKVSVLETVNLELTSKVNELEENEEILRENWRRVADEDANRIQCLEEKVKMLEVMNQELKGMLREAEDDVVLNSFPRGSSLASELSVSRRMRDSSPNESETGTEKIHELEEHLQNMTEEKNTKIEILQEKIANLKENEIKLSETLMEAEHIEQELRARLALYESSQVTVDRMLQYEDKIAELHSSQENLLDRLVSMEDHEETLQEKLERTESEFRAKLSNLEKKCLAFKQGEEKSVTKVKELQSESESLKQREKNTETRRQELEHNISLFFQREGEFTEKIDKLEEECKILQQREEEAKAKVKHFENRIQEFLQREENSTSKISQLEKEVFEFQKREVERTAKLESLEQEVLHLQQIEVKSSAKIVELEKVLVLKEEKINEGDNISSEKVSALEKELDKFKKKCVSLEKLMSDIRMSEQSKSVEVEEWKDKAKELSESVTVLKNNEVNLLEKISSLKSEYQVSVEKETKRLSELQSEKNDLMDKVSLLEKKDLAYCDKIKFLEKTISDNSKSAKNSEEKISIFEKKVCEYQESVSEKLSKIENLEQKKKELMEKIIWLEQDASHLQSVNLNLKEEISILQKCDLQKTNQIETLEKEEYDILEKLHKHDRDFESLRAEAVIQKEQVKTLANERSRLEEKLYQHSDSDNIHQEQLEVLKQSVNTLESAKQMHELEVKDLSQRLDVLDKENKELKASIGGLISDKEQLETEFHSVSQSLSSARKENEDLSASMCEIKSQKDTLETEINNLSQTLNCTMEENDDLRSSMSQCVDSVKKENEDLKANLSDITCAKERFEAEVCTMSQSLDSAMEENKDLQSRLNEITSEKERFEIEIQTLSQTVDSMKKETDDVQTSFRSLKMENQLLKASVGSCQTEQNDLKTRLVELHSSKSELKTELKVALDELGCEKKENHRQKEIIHHLQVESEQLKNNLAEVRRENCDLENKISDMNQNENNLKNRIETLQQEVAILKKLQEKVELLQNAEEKFMDRVVELEKIEEDLRSQLESVASQSVGISKCEQGTMTDSSREVTLENKKHCMPLCDSSTQTSEASDSSSGQGSKKVTGIFQRLQELESENRDLSSKLAELSVTDAQVRQLKEKMKLLEESEDKLMERVMELEEGEERLKMELNKARKNSSSIAGIEADFARLERSEADLKTKLSFVEAEKLALEVHVEELERRNKRAHRESEQENEAYSNILKEKAVLEENIKNLKSKLTLENRKTEELIISEGQMREKLECVLKEKVVWEENLEDLRSRLKVESRRTEELIIFEGKMTEKVDTVLKEKSVLAEAVEALQEEIEEEQTQMDTVQKKMECVLKEKQFLEDKIHILELALADEKHAVEKLKKTESEQRQIHDRLFSEKNALSEKIQNLEKGATEQKKRNEILESSETDLQDNLTCALKEKQFLVEKVKILEKECREEKHRMERLIGVEDRMMKSLSDEKNVMRDLAKELHSTQEKLEEVQTDYEQKLTSLEENKEMLEEKEKKLKGEINLLVKREKELRQEVETLENEITEICDKSKKLEERVKSLEEENCRLKHERKELVQKHEELNSTVRSLREELDQKKKSPVHHPVLPKISTSLLSFPPHRSSKEGLKKSTQFGAVKAGISLRDKDTLGKSSAVKDKEYHDRISRLEKQNLTLEEKSADYFDKISKLEKENVQLREQNKCNLDKNCVLENEILKLKNSEFRKSLPNADTSVLPTEECVTESGRFVTKTQFSVKTPVLANPGLKYVSGFSKSESAVKYLDSSKEELIGTIRQLEKENQEEKERVVEIQDHLAAFREAVESVTREILEEEGMETLEKSFDTFQIKSRSQSSSDSAFHQKLEETIKSEAELRQKVVTLKKKEKTLSTSLSEMQYLLKQERTRNLSRIHGLQEELALATKAHSRSELPVPQTEKVSSVHHRIIELETSEKLLKKKVVDFQLTEEDLRKKLHEAESQCAIAASSRCDGNHATFLFKIEQLEQNEDTLQKQFKKLENECWHHHIEKIKCLENSEKALKRKIEVLESQLVVPPAPKGAMLDKPEDILRQQIKELERLEAHHKKQIADLESDREELHEIARKDKAIIHEQNVRLRELQLLEKVLREQVQRLELSERELYNRCEILEDQTGRLEDRVHELTVHERRLRELVKRLKLDEELWLAKSENMEMTVEELAASEVNLKTRLQELLEEKGGLLQKTEYLDNRVKDLENSETTLFQQVKNFENIEVSLQNRLAHLESCEAAAHSKASELDIMNMDISQRLQRATEENAVLFTHIQELQGQVRNLDRQLLVVKDSELGLKQHVESLEKSETGLQKRIKEYELRDIDSQAKVREFEQNEAIQKDRISALQRSENRLKYRIQELESSCLQTSIQSTSAQKEKLPQKLEDCQKRIIVLQRQIDTLQACVQLKETVSEDPDVVTVPEVDYKQLQAKMVLLGEIKNQNDELESVNAHLHDVVSKLRQGKGSCGHEVELEVYKRRIDSYHSMIKQLKEILPEEQAPSLWAADIDASSQGSSVENLPGRNLQSLESERVFKTVRSLTEEKYGSSDSLARNGTNDDDPLPSDLSSGEEDSIHQIQENIVYSHPLVPASHSQEEKQKMVAKLVSRLESNDVESVVEEEHWRAIESRKPKSGDPMDFSNGLKSVAKATATGSPKHSSLSKQEEIVIGLTLQSESEISHHRSQNDTDSEVSSPLFRRAKKATLTNTSSESLAPPLPKTLPPSLPQRVGTFANYSYYLPSSEQETSVDESQNRDKRVPHLSGNASPMMATSSVQITRPVSSLDSTPDSGRGTASLPSSSRGHNIKDRIAQIEKQLQTKSSGADSRTEDEENVVAWKAKALEKTRQLEVVEKESKNLKDDINKLEKELEEKRRYIGTLDIWLNNLEEMLRNKNKKSDRDIVQHLQTELARVRSELQNSGYRRDDILLDSAALKTELDKKDRELAAKRNEADALKKELRQWQKECRCIEDMRANALDSLRSLEVEVSELQDADKQLKELKDEYNTLRGQYDEVEKERISATTSAEQLQAEVACLTKKCEEKDELISRLKQIKSDGNPLGLLEKLGHSEEAVQEEECIRSLSPITQTVNTDVYTPKKIDVNSFIKSQNSSGYGRRSSASSLGDIRENSDTELHSSRGSPLPQRPKSADQLRGRHLPMRSGVHQSAGLNRSTPNMDILNNVRDSVGRNFPKSLEFVAVADFNPDMFSRSGRPRSELCLKEGDRVKVLGPLDQSGYYEAEVNGRRGLVPATYLLPVQFSSNGCHSTPKERRSKDIQNIPSFLDGSPERVVQMCNQLQQTRPSPDQGATKNHSTSVNSHNHHGTQTPRSAILSSGTQTQSNRPSKSSPRNGPPEAPKDFHVVRLVGETGIMLAWHPPKLDEFGNSNGSSVIGYRLYLNGSICHQPTSSHLAKAVIENVDVCRQHHLAIQTVASNGQVSTRVELFYEGIEAPPGGSESEGDSKTDLSSVLSSARYDQGQKRLFMGLYDYNPHQQSPQDYPGCELAFKAGDTVAVFGKKRPDGFYHGEIDGRRGLVPAIFLEEIPPVSRFKQNPSYSSASQHSPRSTRVSQQRSPRS